MLLTIDLTPRQAARVLEQAVRAQADFEIEPRNLPEDEPLHGKLLGREGELLAVQACEEQLEIPLNILIGAFCEIRMELSGELYNFTTCVLDVVERPDSKKVLLVIPETIQVANRRQYERTNATVASQVRIWAGTQTAPSVGLLANVSAEGMGCNLPGTAMDEVLALGDSVRVSFELAGFDEVFDLPSVICNKSLLLDKQQLFLGMQFEVSPDNAAGLQALQRLRAALFELTVNTSDLDGDL